MKEKDNNFKFCKKQLLAKKYICTYIDLLSKSPAML